jgi:phytoene dehydrogenase-like protein
MYADPASLREEIRRHSKRDAEMIPKYNQMMYQMVGAVKPILGYVPPNPAKPGLRGARTLADFAKHLKSLDKKTFHQFSKIMTMSADDFLAEWIETDVIRALMGISGIIGTMLGVKSPGTAYVLLHHYMGELDGAFTAWGSQKGGTGGVSEALASAARSHGAEIRCNARVQQVIVKNGRAVGVALEDGEEIHAKTIVSAADPYVTFRKLVDEKDLPEDLVSAIDKFKFRGSSGKVNLALDTLPKFSAMKDPTFLRGMTEICPSVDYIEQAYDDAKYGAFSKRPFVDVDIPTVVDPSIARIRQPGSAAGSLRQCCGRHALGVHPEPEGHHPPQAGTHAVGHRAGDRPDRGKHLRGRTHARSAVLLPTGGGMGGLPHADPQLLPVRLGNPPRWWYHLGTRSPRSIGNPSGRKLIADSKR